MSVTVPNSTDSSAERKRAMLAERLKKMATRPEGAPLSFSQQRLWFLDQLQPGSALYNVASVARVRGALKEKLLEKAINSIVERHEALRTRFVQEGDGAVQVIDGKASIQLQWEDLSGKKDLEAEVEKHVRFEVNRPFDLANDRLIRATVLRERADQHVLIITMHHIISDEWSLKVFFSELSAAYSALVNGAQPKLAELPIQYSDFAAWQRKWLRGEILDKQLSFWKNQLGGELRVTELPLDHARKIAPEFRGHTVRRVLPRAIVEKLKHLADEEKSTLFMVLLAAFKCLVARYTGRSDIIVGAPIAGRNRVEAEGLIGFFVNTLPFRTNLSGNPSFREVLRRVRQVTLEAQNHQDLPLDRLAEELRPERTLTHMPFTNLMFTMQASMLERMEFGGITFEFIDVDLDAAKFDFTLVAQDTSKGIVLKAEYDVALFERSTMEACLEHLQILIEGAVEDPNQALYDLPLISAAERALVLETFNRTAAEYNSSKCIHEIFEEQVAHNPGALALHFGERRLTYAELNARANQLAHFLRGLGVGPDVPVAICTSRSPELIVGILGILKAGGAYVPLDSAYPAERLQFMMQETGAAVLLTEQGLLSELPGTKARILCLDSDWEVLVGGARTNPVNIARPDSLAYIMYTSGSTGAPKGVCIPHRGVNRLVINTNYIDIKPGDRIAQVSNVSFDAATFEIWGALLNGGSLIEIGKDLALSPVEFSAELKRQNITAIFLTTALFNQLANDVPKVFSSVKTVLFGGEACDAKSIRKVLDQGPPQRLLHVYGPTENTTFSTWYQVDKVAPEATTVPIGRAISNTQLYVLDPNMNPMPIGVPGELYVGGDGLATGYWKQPELTERAFVASPFRRAAGGGRTLYRTGDLVRWLPEGVLEFIGRIDTQIKIRGFRVELGEIEGALSRHANVRECAVTLQGSNSAAKRLVGYVVPVDGAKFNSSELRAFLKEKLPDYMVPAAFVTLKNLPLTPNGKVNRKALPAPDQGRPELERGYIAPRDAVEAKLAEIWEAVLNVRPVGMEDKFFDLGGHSILAIRLVNQIEKAFGRKLRLATIFQASTIEQLASILREDVRESSLTSRTSLVEIQPRGSKPPLFLVHGAGGGMFWGYVNLAKHLGPDQPVYGFRSRGLDGLEEPETIEELASIYVEDLRKFQPHGPYQLGGYCFGGNVAYEMARQLEQAGEKVSILALINASPANSKYMRIPWTPLWAARFAKNMVYWTKYFLAWNGSQRAEFFAWKFGVLKRRLLKRNGAGGASDSDIDPGNMVDLSSYTEDQKKVWEAHIRALVKYHPAPYGGKVHLLRSGGHPLWCSFEPDYGWGEILSSGIEIMVVPGAHEKVLDEPCVADVAQRLSKLLGSTGGDGESFSLSRTAATVAGGAALAGVGLIAPELTEAVITGAGMLAAASGPATVTGISKGTMRSRLSGEDEQRLSGWNQTAKAFNISSSYINHFTVCARQYPDKAAVRSTEGTLTYKQLDEQSNRLAARLASLGAAPETLVGVCLERSSDLIVSLLAIWKTGAGYLPLDPQYPEERIRYMLEDSKAGLLLTAREFEENFKAIRKIVINDPEERKRTESLPPHFRIQLPDNAALAYVIYTSGSTGQPKGVEITHRSLLNHNFGVMSVYELTSKDRVLQFSPTSFDISVEEIFPTLLSGGTLVLRTDEVISSVPAFLRFIKAEGVTVLNLPTAYWHELVEHISEGGGLPECVRLVVIGGEKASDEAYKRWRKSVDTARVKFINSYGPTEATVTSTYYVGGEKDETLPIGKPLPNVQLVVLDSNLNRVPVGEAGELCIGGAGLARGYLGRPELTAARFIPHKFKDVQSKVIYRTGDIVRFRADGNLEFIGRMDDQVKIRGFRIELGEIESVLLTHRLVKDAAVLAREDKPGDKRLVAYIVPRNGEAPHITELLEFMRKRMPGYLIPSAFVTLPAFPLTPAGKADRRALPPPGPTRPELDQEYIPPRTPLEMLVASIFSDVLGINIVGVKDNFIDLGGHSLLVTQILSRVRESLKMELPLNDVFDHPTVEALCRRIEERSGGSIVVPFKGLPGVYMRELTESQSRIWFLDQYDPKQSSHNIPIGVRLTGHLDEAAMEWSLSELASRHEALRSVFPEEQGKPVQYVCAPSAVHLRRMDLTQVPEERREFEAMEICANEGRKNYITYGLMLNPTLIRLSAREHILLIVLHEVAVDFEAARNVLSELIELYDSRVSHREPELRNPATFQEMVDLRLAAEAESGGSEAFWKNKLTGAPELLDLPADRTRVVDRVEQGARVSLEVPQKVVRRISGSGLNEEAVFLAAFIAVLHRYTGRNDIVLGTEERTIAPPQDRSAVANLENYIPLRQDVSADPGFKRLVEEVTTMLAEARVHRAFPFAKIISLLQPERSSTYSPVFQVLFNYIDEHSLEACPGGLSFVPFEVDHKVARFDIALKVSRRKSRYGLSITYGSGLYDRDRIERLASHFLTLLEAGLESPEEKISRLPIMGEQEHDLVLDLWNRTDRPFSSRKTLIRLFDEQARRTPEAPALVCGTRRVTYKELSELSVRVAMSLRTLGVGTGEKVALCMERSVELVSAILGTFRTGAAYVPVDPTYPRDRIEYMLQDCKAAVVLTQRKLAPGLPASDAKVLCVEDIDWQAPITMMGTGPAPEDLAYIIYTSGSTGKPKGVMIEHRNAVAFVHWARDEFDNEELSGVLAATSICFDLSIFELFAPLCWGGRVILAANALELPSLPAAREVRLINTVPSAIRELVRIRAVPDSVVTINLAGEPLATSLVDDIYAHTKVKRVLDLYGPTETTTYSTWSKREAHKPATIGKPLTNQQVFLLDQKQQPVPVGIPGEVFIGGSGVARGYLNRPDLTAEKFIPHPFAPGERLYRTGDLARWRRDGYLEYLGRIDHQVKVRGFRIELGEIETVLRSHPAVGNAVVVAYEAAPGEKALAGYVEVRKKMSVTPQELQAHIEKRLPGYMVPAVMMVLEVMPLTPNGKIDRKALPSPVAQRSKSSERVEPSSETERRLLEVWKSVLPTQDIGVSDDFFELGGHSLLAIRVVAAIREAMGIELPLFSLFDTPTVEALARQIDAGTWAASGELKESIRVVSRDQALPASFVQERLWFLDQLNPGSDAYNVPAAIRIRGNINIPRLQQALDKVVARHEALRTTFELVDANLIQRIAPVMSIPIEVVELKPVAAEDVAAATRRMLDLHSRKPFDLAAGPLVRAVLIGIGETEHVLLFSMHHTVSDGWSLAVLFKELETFYSSEAEVAAAPALPVQYADYAVWQRETMAGEALAKELEFWKRTMQGAPARLQFPQANPASRSASTAERQTLQFSEAFLKAMTKTAQERGTTPFGILMSALAITLSKWTGQEDLVIGTVVAGRGRRELENLIGCFMNFLPIRAKVKQDAKASGFLQDMRNTLLQAQSHQECPFEKIVEALNPERQGDSNPLYNVALLWQNFPHDLFRGEGLESSIVPVSPSAALLDLRFEAEQVGNDLSLLCEYRSGFLDGATIERMLSSLRTVLERLVEQPDVSLSELAVDAALTGISKPEPASKPATGQIAISGTFTTEPLKEGLEYWSDYLGLNYTVDFAPYNQVFQELLTPTSLLAGNKSGANVTLLRLEDWAGAKGADLLDTEVQAAIDRTLSEFIAALKSFSAANSTPHVLVLCPASNRCAGSPEAVKILAAFEEKLTREAASLPGAHVLSSREILSWYPVENYNDPAAEELGHVPYAPVFYTALATAVVRKIHALKRTPAKVIVLDCDHTLWSGVCGEDGCHGVRVEGPWKFLQEFVKAQRDAGMLLALCSKNNPEDAEEVFARRDDMPLKRSDFAAVRLNWSPKSENIKEIAAELNLGLDSLVFIDDNPVECAEVEANCPDVLTLLLPEKPEEIPAFLKHCWVFDHAKLTAEDRKRADMYRQNSERERLRKEASGLGDFIASLDIKINIAPMTEESAPRVAQLTQRTNQFNLTTIRRSEGEVKALVATHEVLTVSVTDRFGDYGLVGVVMFKCGSDVLDVDTFLLSCRVLGRGVEHKILSHLGELARERKLKRVELRYVPSAKNMPALNFLEGTAGAFKQHTANGELHFRLPAGFASEVTFDVRADAPVELPSEERKGSLPENGRPAKFKACRNIAVKLNDVGRIHKKVESKHAVTAGASREIGAAAETQMEKTLTAMWSGLLHRTDIGVTDNFFDVGGHSLLAVRLFAEIERATGRKFPLVTIFQAPTIRELAVLLQREKQQKPSGPESLLVPIQPQGDLPPLFLVHGAGGDVLWGYANLAAHLGTDRPIYGIKSRGQIGLPECTTIADMAAYYVEAVRTRQPHGPYYLGGYCFGGNVAYEMARILRGAGEEVAMVALLDSSPSNIGYEDAHWTSPVFAARFLRNAYYWLQDFAQQPFRDQVRFVSRKGRVLGRKLRAKLSSGRKGKFDLEEIIDLGHFPQHELKLWQTHLQALVDNVEQPYDGKVTLFRTRGQPVICSFEDDFCWGKVITKGVEIVRIPGSHENIFMDPNVRMLAAELAKSIAVESEAKASPAEVSRV